MKNNYFPFNIITIILLSAYSIIGYSQPVTWYRTWGLPGYNRSEQGIRVCQTFDGGYTVLADVSNGNNEWFDLLKYDELGNLQWVKLITDSTINGIIIKDMQQTLDSGFIFAGFLPLGQGALLIKADKNGNIKWQKSYPNLNSGTRFWEVKQTLDKGYITCGSYLDYGNPSEKGIVTKTDSLGSVQWERQYMDSTFNTYSGIIQGYDENYYLAGLTGNNQRPDYSVLKKLDTLGNVITTNIFYQKSYMAYIVQLKDSSLITGGNDEITYYPLIAKFSSSGNLKWIKTYIQSPNAHFYFYDMKKDFFDNIILQGNIEKGGYHSTIELWKLDTAGTILKAKKLEYYGYSFTGANCINPTLDSGFILTGQINLLGYNDALTIKTDSVFNSPLITRLISNQIPSSDKFKVYNNYPNPFNSSTLVRFYLPINGFANFKIYDLIGKKVFSQKKYFYSGINEYFIDFNKNNLSSGVYFVQINFEDESKLIKIVFLK